MEKQSFIEKIFCATTSTNQTRVKTGFHFPPHNLVPYSKKLQVHLLTWNDSNDFTATNLSKTRYESTWAEKRLVPGASESEKNSIAHAKIYFAYTGCERSSQPRQHKEPEMYGTMCLQMDFVSRECQNHLTSAIFTKFVLKRHLVWVCIVSIFEQEF